MPVSDWQFWVVSLLGLVGLYFLVRPFLPGKTKGGSCPNCASGTAAQKKSRRVALTVDRKHVSR